MNNLPPVDLEQLNLVSNGDAYDRSFVIAVYLRETIDDMQRLQKAIEARHVAEVYRIAHAIAASSLSYGMVAVVPASRRLEAEAKNGDLCNASERMRELSTQFEFMRTFLLSLPSLDEYSRAA